MEKIISLAKRRGFVYQGSEIYGGLAGTWDYGSLGVELKNNIKDLWWSRFVRERDDIYGIDAAILMNAKVWEAAGHVAGFADPLVECKKCKKRFRADHLIDDEKSYLAEKKAFSKRIIDTLKGLDKKITKKHKKAEDVLEIFEDIKDENLKESLIKIAKEYIRSAKKDIEFAQGSLVELGKKIGEDLPTYNYLNKYVNCPNCTALSWSMPRQFNMMFKTSVGALEDSSSVSYLRPETAQGMFVNFKNIIDSFHPKLPFGMAQIGKAFRNEITPREFIFRTREFEQMEIEYFIKETEWDKHFDYWKEEMKKWIADIGLSDEHVHEIEVSEDDRAHYSKRTIDFEYDFPFGKSELYGLAYRTDFDLNSHMKESKVNLEYLDESTNEKFIPHVIEPTFGLDRTILALLVEAYTEDDMGEGKRVYLKFKPSIAPVKAAVFPLMKNKPELVEKARMVYGSLKKEIPQIMWDDNGNVGKRYRRQDEIGTPYCITIDFDTLENDTVTVRDRDTGEQQRISISELTGYIKNAIK